jgi:hypothetical protein
MVRVRSSLRRLGLRLSVGSLRELLGLSRPAPHQMSRSLRLSGLKIPHIPSVPSFHLLYSLLPTQGPTAQFWPAKMYFLKFTVLSILSLAASALTTQRLPSGIEQSGLLTNETNHDGPLPLLDADCNPVPQPRVLSWDSFINYISRPNKNWPWRYEKYGDTAPVTYANLSLSGDGYVWIEDEASAAPFYTLFENGQKWKLVNCSNVFAELDVEMGACTSGDLGIYYNATDLDEGETVMDRGMIGTTRDIAYPHRSAWSVYSLKGFSVTPIPDHETPVGKSLIVEIRAWDETGTYRGMAEHKIVGGEAGYRVSSPHNGSLAGETDPLLRD